MGLALRDAQRHNYGEYLNWPDEQRYELIHGQAYAMSPAPSSSHQVMVVELLAQISEGLGDDACRALVAPVDVLLPASDEADEQCDTVVRPDLLVLCDPDKLREYGVRGAPEWIIEVLSPATAHHDQVIKRDLYEQHGVMEYWLVHPVDRLLTIYRLYEGEYGKPEIVELVGRSAPQLPVSVQIDWERVLRRMPSFGEAD